MCIATLSGKNRQLVATFFALVGDASLQRIHLRLHSVDNAFALSRLAMVRHADDDDDRQQNPGRCSHAGGERQRCEQPVAR